MFDSEEAQVGVMIKAQCTPQMIESPPNTCLKMECAVFDAQVSPKVMPKKEEYILCFPQASDSEFQINNVEIKEEMSENSEVEPQISSAEGQENILPYEKDTNQPDANGVILIEDSSELVPKITSVENQESAPASEDVNAQPDANGVIVIEDSSELTTEEPVQINPANVIVIIEESAEQDKVETASTTEWDEVIVVDQMGEVVKETVQADESAEACVPLIPEIFPEAPIGAVEDIVQEETVPEVKPVNIPRPKSPSRSPPAPPILAFAPIRDDQVPIVINVQSVKLADQKVAMDSGMKNALAAQKEKISYLFSNPSVQQVKVSLYLNASEWSAFAEQI
jgi:hypothetical protein